MTPLCLLNFLLFQWLFVRLARVTDGGGKRIGWTLIAGVYPLTGWWSDYRPVFGRGLVFYRMSGMD